MQKLRILNHYNNCFFIHIQSIWKQIISGHILNHCTVYQRNLEINLKYPESIQIVREKSKNKTYIPVIINKEHLDHKNSLKDFHLYFEIVSGYHEAVISSNLFRPKWNILLFHLGTVPLCLRLRLFRTFTEVQPGVNCSKVWIFLQ